MSGMSSAVAASIPALLKQRALEMPDKPFIVDAHRTLTYQNTWHEANALSAWLHEVGCRSGDRVAIWGPNCHQWIIAALAAQLLGATVVTLNTRFKGEEAADILRRSGSKLLFSVDRFLDTDFPAMLAAHSLPDLEHTVTWSLDELPDILADCRDQGAALLDSPAFVDELVRKQEGVTPDTVSDILFTSGTTGKAKGVVTQHGQNLRAFSQFAEILGLEANDRYLIINPFFHSFGYKAGWLATMIAGATAYPMAVFDVPSVMAAVEQHQINVMPGPPTLFQSILDHPDFDADKLTTLSKATTGAAVIPTQLIEDMRQRLGIDTVITAYGLSESCGLVSMCRRGDDAATIATSSGRAIPGVEVAIMDHDGQAVAAGEVGEIVVRGFNVMQGYFEDPDATRDTVDSAGWLHTGDLGFLDTSGNLHITDRLKDMYICGGFNCYPAEIEQQLLQHPDIAQAAVIGAPDSRLGEVGAAFLVPAQGSSPPAEALIAWCREHMANYKVPRHIVWTTHLPLNATGKVVKPELRKQFISSQQQ